MSPATDIHHSVRTDHRCLIVTGCSVRAGWLQHDVSCATNGDGHRVTPGADALIQVLEGDYDLVLLDWSSLGEEALPVLRSLARLYGSPPVVVLVDEGHEPCVVDALCEGAWSYLPVDDVTDRLTSVLDAARRRRLLDPQQSAHSRLLAQGELILGSDLEEVSGVVQMVVDQLRRVGQCSEADRMRVGIAIEEALLNAIIHGNLAIQSDLRERADHAFERLIARRRQQVGYRHRIVRVSYHVSPEEARISICDEGQGFESTGVPDPSLPEHLTRPSGRGILLMRAFLDEVTFNDCGNVVTLVKRLRTNGDRTIVENSLAVPLHSC